MDDRAKFVSWLVSAWDWASDTGMKVVAEDIAALISHSDEPDYPLWEMAKKLKVTGDSPVSATLQAYCGPYQDGTTPSGWDKQINFSPIIYVDERTWRQIHGSLGWVNRDHDRSVLANNFWLWSNAGNIVRFVIREENNATI